MCGSEKNAEINFHKERGEKSCLQFLGVAEAHGIVQKNSCSYSVTAAEKDIFSHSVS